MLEFAAGKLPRLGPCGGVVDTPRAADDPAVERQHASALEELEQTCQRIDDDRFVEEIYLVEAQRAAETRAADARRIAPDVS